MPRKGRKFVGETWKRSFLYDASHYGYDPTEPDEYASDDLIARAWFRDGPTAVSIVSFDADGVMATHYTTMSPIGNLWGAYRIALTQDEFKDLVRQYMKAHPRPFRPNGRQFASLAYEMLINYVAVGPAPRGPFSFYDTEEDLPRHVRMFLKRSS
jgi:hypothetical protein